MILAVAPTAGDAIGCYPTFPRRLSVTHMTTTTDPKSIEATTPADCSPWLPVQLRTPSVSGVRGDVKFAFFATKRRLLVERAGEMMLYDCGDHLISGMRAPSGLDQALVFTSQYEQDLPLGALQQLS
jgi:hypothetical protein